MAGAVQIASAGASTAGPALQPVAQWTGPSWAAGLHLRLHDFVKRTLLKQLMFPGASVCDLFCGRGTDTAKWAQAKAGHYIGVDLSASALQEAREEWDRHGNPYPAYFCELDPCMIDLKSRLEGHGLPADMVCCLGHLQDSFADEDMVKRLLKNVAALLKPGGIFLGITPDSSTIWYKYQKAVEGAMKTGSLRVNGALPRVRSELYSISFEDDRFHFYGTKYQLRFADDGLPPQAQLLVHFPSLIRLAEEVGLECVEIQNLFDFYEDFRIPFAEELRSSCGTLLDAKGRLPTQAHEILMLYATFIFQKVKMPTTDEVQSSANTEAVQTVSSKAKDHAFVTKPFVTKRDVSSTDDLLHPPSKKSKTDVAGGRGKRQDHLSVPAERAGHGGRSKIVLGDRIGQRLIEERPPPLLQQSGVELLSGRSQIREGHSKSLMEHKEDTEPNVSSGQNQTMKAFVDLTEKLTGSQIPRLQLEAGRCHRDEGLIDTPASREKKRDLSLVGGLKTEMDEGEEPCRKRKYETDEEVKGIQAASAAHIVPSIAAAVSVALQDVSEGGTHNRLLVSSSGAAEILSGVAVEETGPNQDLSSREASQMNGRSALYTSMADQCLVATALAAQSEQGLHAAGIERSHEQLGLSRGDATQSGGFVADITANSRSAQSETGDGRIRDSSCDLQQQLPAVCAQDLCETRENDKVKKKVGRSRKRWEPIAPISVFPEREGELCTVAVGRGLVSTSEAMAAVKVDRLRGGGEIRDKSNQGVYPGSESCEQQGQEHLRPMIESDLEKPPNLVSDKSRGDHKQGQGGKMIHLTKRYSDGGRKSVEAAGSSSKLSKRSQSRDGGDSENHDEGMNKAGGRKWQRRRHHSQQQQDSGGTRGGEDHFARQGRQPSSGPVHSEQREVEMYRRQQMAPFGYATGEGLAAAVAIATGAARNSLQPEAGYAFFRPSVVAVHPTRGRSMQEIQLVAGHSTPRGMSSSSGILGPGPGPPSFTRLHGLPTTRELASIDNQAWQSHSVPHDRRITGVHSISRYHRDEWGGQHASFVNGAVQRGPSTAPKFDSRNSSHSASEGYGISSQSNRNNAAAMDTIRPHGISENRVEGKSEVPMNVCQVLKVVQVPGAPTTTGMFTRTPLHFNMYHHHLFEEKTTTSVHEIDRLRLLQTTEPPSSLGSGLRRN